MLIRLLSIICLLYIPSLALAQPMNFYGATVPVASQTSRERTRAAEEGLKQVLVRVSGSSDAILSAEIQSALPNAANYLEQYSYQINTLEYGEKQEQMVMVFSPLHVRKMLSKASLPVWPTNRPKVLLWLVEDEYEVGKHFVSGIESPVTLGLEHAARTRGLPITFPLMDLDDQLALSAEQVWSLDESAIVDASERYGVDTILVGRYTQTSQGQWWGTWQFFHRGQNRVYDLRTNDGEALGDKALQPLADYLANLYSVTTTEAGGSLLYVQVNQVDQFKSYKSLLNYINGLAVVSSHRLILIENNQMLLGVQLAGDINQFNNAIALDGKLRPELAQNTTELVWFAVPEGSIDSPLKYRWFGE